LSHWMPLCVKNVGAPDPPEIRDNRAVESVAQCLRQKDRVRASPSARPTPHTRATHVVDGEPPLGEVQVVQLHRRVRVAVQLLHLMSRKMGNAGAEAAAAGGAAQHELKAAAEAGSCGAAGRAG